MNADTKLMKALELLQDYLASRIKEIQIDEDLIRLKITLRSSIRIYVNYNNYNQYSYVIYYSPDPMDRIIIDNYDEDWDVESSPNHIHLRYEKEGKSTEFVGDPTKDIERLIKLI